MGVKWTADCSLEGYPIQDIGMLLAEWDGGVDFWVAGLLNISQLDEVQRQIQNSCMLLNTSQEWFLPSNRVFCISS